MFEIVQEPEDGKLGIVKIAPDIVAAAVLGVVVFIVSALLALGAMFLFLAFAPYPRS
jgi:hypothetical protein